MPVLSATLGYYPLDCNHQVDSISLTNLPDYQQSVVGIEASTHVHNDWLYAPQSTALPYNARVFGLPKTHELTHDNADSVDHMEFLVWCIGFFLGMRLTTTEAGFLDATPIKPRELTDFELGNNTLSQAIALSESFWQQHSQDVRRVKRVEGIIHALFLSQNPRYLDFEKFTYLYAALDACYAQTKSIFVSNSYPSHAKRLHWMCQQLEMPTPSWAVPANHGTEISLVRNDSFHEALFLKEPLGFAIYGYNISSGHQRNVLLEMQALVCRLTIALLGKPNCSYVRSPVDSRQRHELDLT